MLTMAVGLMTDCSALYYPYSRCTDELTLKATALLFEAVYFIDPLEHDFREFLMFGDAGSRFAPDALRHKWDAFHGAGVFKIIDPSSAIHEHDDILTAAYFADWQDEQFSTTALGPDRISPPWKMLAKRMPPAIDKVFAEKSALGASDNPNRESDWQIGVFSWELYDHYGYREYLIERLGGRKAVYPSYGREIREKIFASPIEPESVLFVSGSGTSTDSGMGFGMHPYHYVENVSFQGEPIRVLAYEQGLSLNLSQALLLSGLHDLIPVTDSGTAHRLLNLKYARAREQLSRNLPTAGSVPSRPPERIQSYQILARALVMETLSRTELEALSAEQILEFRQENASTLRRFWMTVAELSQQLDVDPGNPEFANRVFDIVDTKVRPEMARLRENLQKSKAGMFRSLLSKVATALPTTATASVFANLSMPQILAAGAAGAAAALGIGLPSAIKFWEEREAISQSGMAFLINLERAGASATA